MAETFSGEQLFTEQQVLEGLTPDQLVDYILDQGGKVSELERVMNLAVIVLDGYGTSVDEVLTKRESKENGET